MNALNYLMNGDHSNLSNEEKRQADLWLQDWELLEITKMTQEEKDEHKREKALKPIYFQFEESDDEYGRCLTMKS